MAELEKYNISGAEKAKLLVKYGFINSAYQNLYSTATTPEEREKIAEKYIDKLAYKDGEQGHADQEYDEEQREQWMGTDYPSTIRRYKVDYERYDMSLEESYFWVLNWLKIDAAYVNIIKVMDIFSAAAQSDFWGVASQRIGLQQDKVSQFLATIGKMIKELFQIVREMRILDERLNYYINALSGNKSAEITLKGIYIDMAEGGAKNPASIFGMAHELQFVTLPDLFFDAPPTVRTETDVDDYVDNLKFNESVKRVLKRKLYSFLKWKESTYKEIKVRRTFTLKYLRQHFDIIRMYAEWIKPYLKNIRRLTMSQSKADTADLISAFEGSMIEIEFIAAKKVTSKYNSVVLVNFDCRTRPTMSFHQEGYQQRGPIHTGRIVINMRAYSWTDDQIKNYVKMRNEESLKLLTDIDESVKAAMEALGDDLMRYLGEAGETRIPKIEEEKGKEGANKPSVLDPFLSVFKGAGELGKAFFPISKSKKVKRKKEDKFKAKEAYDKTINDTIKNMWTLYDKYKKAHGMLSW